MRIVSLQQNSKDWELWRKSGLGASDAPAVMGVSPWTTPFQLWAEATGRAERPPANEFALAAMKRGQELEPVVRGMFEKINGPFPAIVGMHNEYDYIRASFDGLSDTNELLEIKCPGKADHATAVAGKVPNKYFPQIQQQFLVSGAQRGFYVSWDGKSEILTTLVVYPDHDYMEKLLKALQQFWARVEMKIPPEVQDVDRRRAVARVLDANKRLTSAVNMLSLVMGV